MLFGLGYWQLQRAEQKQIWLDQQAVEPMTRAATALRQLERQAWVPVRLEVELLPYRIFLLDNRTLNGRVGYEVIVPMRVDEGSLWLASLGWVEAPSAIETGCLPCNLNNNAYRSMGCWLIQPGR